MCLVTVLLTVLSVRCSDGVDRYRQEWIQSGCNVSVSFNIKVLPYSWELNLTVRVETAKLKIHQPECDT